MTDNPIVSWFDTLTHGVSPADRDANVVIVAPGGDEAFEPPLSTWLPESYRVDTVRNEEAARDRVADGATVAILDRRALDGSGIDGLRRLRHDGVDCRVVLLTATAPDGDAVEALADVVIERPIEEATFRGTVRSFVERDAGDASSVGPDVVAHVDADGAVGE